MYKNKTSLPKKLSVQPLARNALESYIRQYEAKGRNPDELTLRAKRGPKNKRKNRLCPGSKIKLQNASEYDSSQILLLETLGEEELLVQVTSHNANVVQKKVKLSEVVGYDEEGTSKKKKKGLPKVSILII